MLNFWLEFFENTIFDNEELEKQQELNPNNVWTAKRRKSSVTPKVILTSSTRSELTIHEGNNEESIVTKEIEDDQIIDRRVMYPILISDPDGVLQPAFLQVSFYVLYNSYQYDMHNFEISDVGPPLPFTGKPVNR